MDAQKRSALEKFSIFSNIAFIVLILALSFGLALLSGEHQFLLLAPSALLGIMNIKLMHSKSKFARDLLLGVPLVLATIIAALARDEGLFSALLFFVVFYLLFSIHGILSYLVAKRHGNDSIALRKSPALWVVLVLASLTFGKDQALMAYNSTAMDSKSDYQKSHDNDKSERWVAYNVDLSIFGSKYAAYFDPEIKDFIIAPGQNRTLTSTSEFNDGGTAIVEETTNRFGTINSDGNFVITPKYRRLYAVDEEIFAFQENHGEKFGLMDSKGTTIKEPTFDRIGAFSDQGLAVAKKNEKYGYINKKGKLVIPLKFDYAEKFHNNGLAVVLIGDKRGFINRDGEIINSGDYISTSVSPNGMVSITTKEFTTFFKKSGEFALSVPTQYMGEFSTNNLARFQTGPRSKYGYINTDGKVVINQGFDLARPFRKDGLAVVGKDGKFGYINEKGAFEIPPIFDNALPFSDFDLARVTLNGKHGFINRNGDLVIDAIFDNAEPFSEKGFSRVEIKKDRNQATIHGLIDTEGRLVLKLVRDCGHNYFENVDGDQIWTNGMDSDCESES